MILSKTTIKGAADFSGHRCCGFGPAGFMAVAQKTLSGAGYFS